MGITPITAAWMWDLQAKGVFGNADSVIDFGGPQQLNCAPKEWLQCTPSFVRDNEACARFEEELRKSGPRPSVAALKAFYNTLGFRNYFAIDLIDPVADYRTNFNQPYEPERQFDVVCNIGTAEHVFNIGEAFRTIHKLLKPGGIALHIMPTYGAYYHGFYNIHSVVFRSLAAQSDYELVNLSYAHDILKENKKFLSGQRHRLDDITSHEVRSQNAKFFWHYFWSVLTRGERPISLIHAALRKKTDSEFVFPQQINKYTNY